MRILVLFAILSLCSCTVYDESYVEEQTAVIEHSDIEMGRARYILSQSGRQPVVMESARMSYWMDDNRIEAESPVFSQNGEDGEPDISGSAGRAVIEVSGGVNKNNLEAYCQAGPDVISMGALTHSVPAKDLSLKIVQYIS